MKLRYSKNHKALHRLGIIKSKVFPKGLTWLVLNLLRVQKGRNWPPCGVEDTQAYTRVGHLAEVSLL